MNQFKTVIPSKTRITQTLAALLLGSSLLVAFADQSKLSPGVQQVLKLSQAHMSDDVITSYIRNSTDTYKLSADDIVYLSGQGVSQSVISALLQKTGTATASTSAPVSAPPVTQPAISSQPAPQVLPPGGQPPISPQVSIAPSTPPTATAVDMNYFQAQLTPYGHWIDLSSYGMCWVPSVQNSDPDWRPYFNGGHWEYTENGWYWSSDYPWGDVVFHYGRWIRTPLNGWVWVPGYDWAPAWVCWRNVESEGYCGWAPLPPGARYTPGVGIMWDGRVATDADFGLAPDMFVFVPFDHFWVHDYVPWCAPYHRVHALYGASVVINGYGFVGGHFFIGGLGRERIAMRTHHDIVIFRVGYHEHYVPEHRVIEHERYIDHGRVYDHRDDRHDRRFFH